MNRSADMQRLSEEILVAYEQRIQQLADLRRATHQHIRHAAATRQQQAARHAAERAAYTHQLRTTTRQQQAARHAARSAQAQALHAELDGYVSTLRANTAAQVQDYAAQHADMAATQADTLRAFVTALRADTAAQVQDYAAQHADMAATQADTLRAFVTALRADTAAQVQDYQTQRNAMAASERKQRATARRELAQAVQAMRTELQTEHRQIWLSWRVVEPLPTRATAFEGDATLTTMNTILDDADQFARQAAARTARAIGRTPSRVDDAAEPDA